jgi:hypothetical protein
MDDVRAANRRIGNHWFDPDTLRFFGGRVSETLYGGRFFVSSERDSGGAWDGRRFYSVRVANDDGTIGTVGEFGAYASRSGAHRAAARLSGAS